MRLIQGGTIPFAVAWGWQREIFEDVVNGGEDTLLLLEHPHVYTLGRVTDETNILLSDQQLARIGAEKFEIDRGGDVTYHGPGQLVGYPILNLAHFKEDLGWYLRTLEESLIALLANYDIEGHREGRTGVWVNLPVPGTRNPVPDSKIAAIGIKCSRWCTMHGFALNVNTNLSYFDHIVPCGIRDKGVTSMEQVLSRKVDMNEVRGRYRTAFEKTFDVKLIESVENVTAVQL